MSANTDYNKRVQTPWGVSDCAITYADGIVAYSTPGHGGFELSRARMLEMPDPIRDFKSRYAPRGWYEEDCDCALVVVAFPEFFEPQMVHDCIHSVNSSHGREYFGPAIVGWLVSEHGAKARAIADTWFNEHRAQFRFGSQWGGHGGIGGQIARVDGKENYVYTADHWPKLEEPFTLEQARADGLKIDKDDKPATVSELLLAQPQVSENLLPEMQNHNTAHLTLAEVQRYEN